MAWDIGDDLARPADQDTPLTTDGSEDWVQELWRNGADLQAALNSRDPIKIRSCFGRYRFAAGERFFQVDAELKDLCDQLRAIGVPLAAVAQLLAALEPLPAPAGERQSAGRLPPEERASLERQLVELQENLRLIDERIAEFVQETDIPLQLKKDKGRLASVSPRSRRSSA